MFSLILIFDAAKYVAECGYILNKANHVNYCGREKEIRIARKRWQITLQIAIMKSIS